MTPIDPCPPLAEVLAASPGPAIREHLGGCRRCRALRGSLVGPEALRETSLDAEYYPAVSLRWSSANEGVVEGAVHAIQSPHCADLELAVIKTVSSGEATVSPLSEDPTLTARGGLFVPKEVLGFRAVVRTAIAGRVLLEQIAEPLGIIPAAMLNTRDANGEGVDVELREQWEPYFEPALSLQRTVTLGELITLRRIQATLTEDELAAAAETTPQDVRELEQGHLPLDQLPPSRLAAIFQRLSVMFSQKLATRVTLTLATTQAGSAMAGRRQNRPSTPTAAKHRADSYVAELEDTMMSFRGRNNTSREGS